MTDKKELEEGTVFTPKFDDKGLIPCVTTSAKTGKVLMFAWMNEDALKKTIETGEAHYWSRSRAELWHKGASSGMVQSVVEMRTDCDQDCILLSVNVAGTQDTKGSEASCHTGRYSCFYRLIPVQNGSGGVQMKFIDDAKIFNPDDVY